MNFFNDLIKFDLKKDMGIYNLTDEFFCVLLNKINLEEKNVLVVVNSLFEANKLYNSLSNYTDRAYLFPMDDFLTSEALAISPDLTISRLETLNQIISGKKCIVITNLMGYLRFLPEKIVYQDSILKLKVGDVIDPKELANKLYKIGYVRDTLVNKTGDYGVRGFIIDVFPIGLDNPVRIEFFDDEIDSIRYFDPDSQKSINNINEVEIYPYIEFITSNDVPDAEFGKQKFLQKYGKVSSISNYLDDTVTIYKDIDQLKLSYNNIIKESLEYREEKDKEFNLNYMMDLYSIKENFPIYYFSLNNIVDKNFVTSSLDFSVRTINKFNENSDLINKFINEQIKSKTVLICLKPYQLNSIKKYLNMPYVASSFSNIRENKVNLIDISLNEGFIYNNIIVLTSNELFNIKNSNKKYNTKFKYSSAINDIKII